MSEEKLLIGAANNNDDKNEEEEMEIVGDDLLCGLGSCRPAWLQRCNNIKLFMFVISIFSITQGKPSSFNSFLIKMNLWFEKLNSNSYTKFH